MGRNHPWGGGQPWYITEAACLLKPFGKEKDAEVHLRPVLTDYITSHRKAVLPDSHVLPTFLRPKSSGPIDAIAVTLVFAGR